MVIDKVTPGNDNMMTKLDTAESYPYLLRALGGEDGFDPKNPSVQKSMHSLLDELNGILSTTYLLNVHDIWNKKHHMLEFLGPKAIVLFWENSSNT